MVDKAQDALWIMSKTKEMHAYDILVHFSVQLLTQFVMLMIWFVMESLCIKLEIQRSLTFGYHYIHANAKYVFAHI